MEGSSKLTCGRKVYVSFGGLLLFLEGSFKKLKALKVDHVYLLLKR